MCRQAISDLPKDQRELRLSLEATALDADALRGVRREHPAELEEEVKAASTPGERRVLTHVISDLAATGERSSSDLRRAGRMILDGGRFLDEVGPTSPTYIYLGTALAWAGAYQDVVALTTHGIEEGRRSGSPVAISYSAALRSGVALLTGDLDLAEEDSELVVTELAGADPMSFAVALAWYIEVLVERGDPERAREVLQSSGLTGELPELGTIDFLMLARGSLALAEGDPNLALAEFLEVGERANRARYLNPAAMDWRSRAALVLASLGEQSRAEELAGDELARAEAFGAPRALGIALRARGSIDRGQTGVADLWTAAELLKPVSPVEHARTLVMLGNLLHELGQDSARETLYLGMDIAHHCGSASQVETAMEGLRVTGARPRRPTTSGSDALTPQERRISQLAADGLGNREIAETLFLTRRTVEMHLSNTYRKLGITSRKELPGALVE